MSIAPIIADSVLGFAHAGMLMTPDEFDAITEYDEHYGYELIHGVLVVNPIPGPEETGPNELLGHLLWQYQHNEPRGAMLDETLPQQYIRTPTARRLADRAIWTGLGRIPNPKRDTPTIAIELVSAGRRNSRRDCVEKKREYGEAGVREFWIIDRFRRTMTVVQYGQGDVQELIVNEGDTYESALLPGFSVPIGRLLRAADRWAQAGS